jgi:hypothetical protein
VYKEVLILGVKFMHFSYKLLLISLTMFGGTGILYYLDSKYSVGENNTDIAVVTPNNPVNQKSNQVGPIVPTSEPTIVSEVSEIPEEVEIKPKEIPIPTSTGVIKVPSVNNTLKKLTQPQLTKLLSDHEIAATKAAKLDPNMSFDEFLMRLKESDKQKADEPNLLQIEKAIGKERFNKLTGCWIEKKATCD